jgi:hypothetical protein
LTLGRPSAVELLEQGMGLLTRSHLRELGIPRAGVDAIFRRLDVIVYPGYSRPMIRVEDFLELTAKCTYPRDRVRPS